ncbi:ABC transporter substrate-binding protein, partial [Candidatus Bathyarchaeota archaeon]|nr:ABC transporter substrate-binding protein [Candidatus Bathyarchaeota archaeon]
MRRESLILAILLLTVFAISSIAIVPTQAVTATPPKVTIIAPGNANIVRRQWGQIIANSLTQLGFDARLVFLGWAAVYDRVLTPAPANVGKTYDQGGWDIELMGWTPGLIANPRALFLGDAGFFAPTGQNYYLYNSTKSNQLLNLFVTTANDTVRAKALQDWQWVFYNDNPASQLLYEKNVAVVSPHVVGYDWIYFNVAGTPQWLKKTGTSNDNTVIYGTTGEITSLIPASSNSWYDTVILTAIYSGLLEVNNARQPINGLLTSYTTSSDGHTWTLNLRPNVQWHTGVTFTADDVLYTFVTMMNTLANSQFVGYYADVLGNDLNVKWLNGTTTRVYYNGSVTLFNPSTVPSGTRKGNMTSLDANTVQLYLPNIAGLTQPYGFFGVETLLGNNIMPKHVLQKIPYDQWSTSPMNTGTGTLTIQLPNGTDYTLKGPIGTGPYMFESYDVTAQLVHMKKFNNFWNRTALEAIAQFGITDYYVRYIADKTSALAALKNGEVDMLDPQYHMQKDVPTIESSWGVVYDLVGAGRQEMAFNMKHPLWGTGTGTPVGTAEAARHLRLAVDYA